MNMMINNILCGCGCNPSGHKEVKMEEIKTAVEKSGTPASEEHEEDGPDIKKNN
jgi:hypothetical protein